MSVDDDIAELEKIVRRANEAFRLGKHSLVDELLKEARRLVDKIDPELRPPTWN